MVIPKIIANNYMFSYWTNYTINSWEAGDYIDKASFKWMKIWRRYVALSEWRIHFWVYVNQTKNLIEHTEHTHIM